MLYKRDFGLLTTDEQEQIDRAENYYAQEKRKSSMGISPKVMNKYHEMLPSAAYHYRSLFPNNYLNTDILSDSSYLDQLKKDFGSLLAYDCTERDILNFINKNEHYPIIGSIFYSGFNFGHHEAFLFKEFELSSTFIADYLLVGKSSGGYEFVFIELENPSGQITRKSGELGTTFRKGIEQVQKWESWIEANFHSLRLIFQKHQNVKETLPNEFTIFDKSRFHFVVIAGRRSDFNDSTYEIKRRFKDTQKITLLHYDNLLDNFGLLKSAKNY